MKQFASFPIGGQTWTAWYVTKAEMATLDPETELEGLCDFKSCRMYVRKFRNKDRRRDALIHEVCHAFLEATGVGNFLEDSYSGPDFGKFEEGLIRLVVPHLATLIGDKWNTPG